MGRAVGRWLVTTPGANAPPLLNQEGSLLGAPGWAPLVPEEAGGCHHVYENTDTYRKFGRFVLNCMSLMGKDLQKSGGCGGEKRGIKK